MLPYSFRLSRLIILLFFLFALGYGLFEARGIVLGPRIEIDDAPVRSESSFVRIQGRATHIASISMNGAEIPVTAEGAFDEPYLLGPGENRIELAARDKYGNETRRTVVIYYQATSSPPAPAPEPAASSSPQDASSSPSTATSTVAD